MRIVIESYAEILDGFNTKLRGEDLWVFSIGRVLAEYGHEVTFVGFSEGKPIVNKQTPRVTWLDKREIHTLKGQEFDCLFILAGAITYIDNYRDRWNDIVFKKRLVGCFENKTHDQLQLLDNEILVTPFSYGDHSNNRKPLPIPFGEFQESKFDNKTIAWTAKDIIHWCITDPEWFRSFEYAQYSKSSLPTWLSALQKVAKNYPINFFSLSKEENDYLQQFENKYTSMGWFDYQAKLRECSIAIPLHRAGSLGDVVFNGLVPILPWNWLDAGPPDFNISRIPYLPQYIINELSHFRRTHEWSENDIIMEIEWLMNDKTEYNNRLDLLRLGLSSHLDHIVEQYFSEIMEP